VALYLPAHAIAELVSVRTLVPCPVPAGANHPLRTMRRDAITSLIASYSGQRLYHLAQLRIEPVEEFPQSIKHHIIVCYLSILVCLGLASQPCLAALSLR
jgi:hypothetical protein